MAASPATTLPRDVVLFLLGMQDIRNIIVGRDRLSLLFTADSARLSSCYRDTYFVLGPGLLGSAADFVSFNDVLCDLAYDRAVTRDIERMFRQDRGGSSDDSFSADSDGLGSF